MTNESDEKRHVGGASGAASRPEPPEPATGTEEETGAPGEGGTEIPLGIPVNNDEWNRMKEDAQRPARRGDDEGGHHEDEPQEDAGLDK